MREWRARSETEKEPEEQLEARD